MIVTEWERRLVLSGLDQAILHINFTFGENFPLIAKSEQELDKIVIETRNQYIKGEQK